MDTMISVRVDKTQKDKAKAILKRLGLDLSTAINIYINKIVMEGGIPFMIHEPSERLYKAIDDAEKGIGLSKPYTDVDELFNDILKGKEED